MNCVSLMFDLLNGGVSFAEGMEGCFAIILVLHENNKSSFHTALIFFFFLSLPEAACENWTLNTLPC